MSRRQKKHKELTTNELISKWLNRGVLSRFNMDFKKEKSRRFGKRFRSLTKAFRYYKFMQKNRRIEC